MLALPSRAQLGFPFFVRNDASLPSGLASYSLDNILGFRNSDFHAFLTVMRTGFGNDMDCPADRLKSIPSC